MEILQVPIIALALLGLAAGIYLLRGQYGRRAGFIGAGLLFFSIPMTAFAVKAIVDDLTTDWNPDIASDGYVLGEWTKEDLSLTLEPGGAAIVTTSSGTERAEWRRDDWNLALKGDGWSRSMRFYKVRGTLRLLPNPGNDPDSWHTDAGMTRK